MPVLLRKCGARKGSASPFLIGNYMDGDKIHDVPQKSWIDEQMSLDLE